MFSIESFTYGTLSPVNIDSLTTTYPFKSNISQGTDLWDSTFIFSTLNNFGGKWAENGI